MGAGPFLATRRRPRAGAVLAVAGSGAFLAFLDSTIVNVAFPSIRTSFPSSSLSALSWVLNAYNLVFAGCLVAAGRFADLLGRRRMFVIGTTVFVVASAGCAAASSVAMLIGFRVVQGVGCAILVPASLAMVIEAFPAEKLTEAVTLWGATAALAAGLGPPIGGALVSAGNWRLAFVINIPLGLVAVLLAQRVAVESRAPGRRRLPDVLGTVLLIAAFTGLTLAVIQGHEWGWTSPAVLGAFAAALVLFMGFAAQNARHPVPVLDPDLLHQRRFAVANLTTIVAAAGFYAYGLTHILWLRYVWGYSLFQAGLAVAPGALAAAVAAAVLGRVAERHGHRPIIVGGALVWALALTWYVTQVGVHPDFLGEWLPGQLISGIGVGATLPVVAGAAVDGVGGGRYAAASAAVSSTRQFGAVLGIAILVAIIGTPTAVSAATDFRHGWAFSAGCFVAAALVAVALGPARAALRSADESPNGAAPPAPGTSATADEPEAGQPKVKDKAAGLFEALPVDNRVAVDLALEPVDLRAGAFLFHAGDVADGMYLVRSGQLEVVIGGTVVSRLVAGDVVGELALLTDERRSASIRARRDSRLDRLSPAAFTRLMADEPGLATALARRIATRLQQLTPPVAPRAAGRVVAIVGLDAGAPVREVTAQVVRSMSGYLRTIDPGPVDSSALEQAEQHHDRVVLSAAHDEPTRREFCLRNADRIVLVSRAGGAPPHGFTAPTQDWDLVVAAPVERSHLAAWYASGGPISVHRLSGTELEAGLRALSARLAQRAIGLVLAGGGARSFAHLGVLEELENAGVVVDRVAGASAGAVIAALYATGRSAEETDAVVYEEFVRRNPLGDLTIPRHGLIRGERTAAGIRRHLGDQIFEELPRELHVVSVDLLRRRPVIHSRGTVSDAVSASLRIPGVFPPMRLGDAVHVDGAVLDNLPVGALEAVPEGPIIAVNIGLGGADTSTARRTGVPRPPRMPGMAETLMRTMFMSGAAATAAAVARSDVVITPQTGGIGFLEWHQIDVAREAGRAAAAQMMPAILDLVRRPAVTDDAATRV